ncbi:MAG: hypothetical protein AAFV85_04010 [Cyanobacteria bacterium J06634_6]
MTITTKLLQKHQNPLESASSLYRNQLSWLKSLNVTDISKQYSTPLYITNWTQLLNNLKIFSALLKGAENVYFPVKTSPCLATFRMLSRQGCGADCASPREIQLARLAGVQSSQISYYSPSPDLQLAASLLQDGSSVIIDAPSKLADLETLLGNTPFSGKLMLRVNSPLYNSYLDEAEYQKHTAHGSLTSQFGIPSEEVLSLLASTKLPISGLHAHVGTQMDNVEIFQESLDALHELCDVIHAVTHHQIDTLNLGGGLGVAAHEGEKFPSIADLADALENKFKPDFAYKMEPGSALFGNATALLTQVVTRKSTRGKGWAIVNVGSDQLFKVTLAGFAQEVLLADGTPLPREGSDSVAGPLCFAGDVLLPETDLSSVEEGDVLILPNAGAYCRAIGNRFNGHSEPGTLIVQEDQVMGLAYINEDSYWEPTIQSYRPLVLTDASSVDTSSTDTSSTGGALESQSLKDQHPRILNIPSQAFTPQQVDKLRSVYLHKQCGNDAYSFHDFTKVSEEKYEMTIAVESPVSFISAPLVMRIISDATIAVVVDSLGSEEKEISVWGSRFNVSLDSILRSDRQHLLEIQLTQKMTSPHAKKQELIAYWQLGKGASHGNILVIV